MAELKRNFSQAKMNKDMDERVLSPGQYRDAKNIQISTSDGSNVGTVQSLLGNTEVTSGVVSTYSTCVGAIDVPEKDLIYYFVSSEGSPSSQLQRPDVWKDYIIEYNTIDKTTKYVFVDIFKVTTTAKTTNHGAGNNYIDIDIPLVSGSAINTSGIRTGMKVTGIFTNSSGGNITYNPISNNTGTTVANASTYNVRHDHDITVTDIVYQGGGGTTWRVYHDYKWFTLSGVANLPVTANDKLFFIPEEGAINGRVLQFNSGIQINAINYIDGMLFWTDGFTEPKKINVARSLAGTGGTVITKGWDDAEKGSHVNNTSIPVNAANQVFNLAENNDYFHTRLVISRVGAIGYMIATAPNNIKRVDVAREHVTVIKKYPKFPLKLKMSTTSSDRTPDGTASNPSPAPNQVSAAVANSGGALTTMDFVDGNGDPLAVGDALTIYFDALVDFRVNDTIVFTNDTTVQSGDDWDPELAKVSLKCTSSTANRNNPKKGPYGFQVLSVDGDVPSTPEQWYGKLKDQEPLFQFKFPRFSYRWRYEDGEYSTFAPWSDVAFIPGDFDYKAKKGYNVGMVNHVRSLILTDYFQEFTLVPRDVVGVDLLYKEDGKPTVYTVKSLTQKDGAPFWPDRTSNYNRGEFELTTEMIHAVVPSNQMLRPWDNVPKTAKAQEIAANRLIYANYKQGYEIRDDIQLSVGFNSSYADQELPMTSVKTLRTYQVGVVFSDEYGRETPVLVPKTGSTIKLDKKWSTSKNVIKARLQYPSNPPYWAKYLRYYIKETSNEYYNLTQDRWYNAEDGNIWLSFPSSERNKVDDETFLILKNEHDGDRAVTDDTRYKVIAIENDAPIFIKTTQKSHGQATITGSTGAQLAASKNMLLSDTEFEAGYGAKFYVDTLPKISSSNLYARITGTAGGTVLTSRYIGVTQVVEFTTNNFNIILDEPIGDTADMDSLLSGTIVYKVELREDAIQNKAEFEGRFFVKVLKDTVLQKYIMKLDTSDPTFTITDSYNIRFICAPPGVSVAGNHSAHESDDYDHPSANTNAQYGTTVYRANNYEWDDNSTGGTFDSGDKFGYCGGLSDTRSFWDSHRPNGSQFNGDWFIDAATFSEERFNYQKNTSSWPHKAQGGDENGLHNSHNNGHISKGRGIRIFTNKTAQIWFGVLGWGNDHTSSQKKFKAKMTTPGTLWRFRNDPNETVYKTIAHKGSLQVGNFVTTTSSCNSCVKKNGEESCRRDMFSITFDRLDGTTPGTVNGQANVGVIDYNDFDPLSLMKHNGKSSTPIDILQLDTASLIGTTSLSTDEPGIWETEPKEDVGLDIYYEASGSLPLDVTHKDNELLIPLFSTFRAKNLYGGDWHETEYVVRAVNSTGNPDTTNITFRPKLQANIPGSDSYIELTRHDGSQISLYVGKASGNYQNILTGDVTVNGTTSVTGSGTAFTTECALGEILVVTDPASGTVEKGVITVINNDASLTVSTSFAGSFVDASAEIQNRIDTIEVMTGKTPKNLQTGATRKWRAPHYIYLRLGWHNCWRFGNGVESDRVRDDFNAPQLANGVKASTVLATPYDEEHKSSGLIFSGIYNSISGVNDLNQFIQAEPITKDLNPRHGSIQALVTRDTNTVVFCEDKVFSVLTNKDALFNADGNSNVTSNTAVLGQAVPMSGDYGISTNPESLAVTSDSIYFSDQMRGQVLQLSGNSIVPISEIGMKDFFNDNLKPEPSKDRKIVGSFDDHKAEYNVTLKSGVRNQWRYDHDYTISFNEVTKGWTSFKDFKAAEGHGLEVGISLNSKYYTFSKGSMYEHHSLTANNNFYGQQYDSEITMIFNDDPSAVKSFNTLNYEGTQARQTAFTTTSTTNPYVDPSNPGVTTTISNITDSKYHNLTTKTGWYVDSVTTDLQETENLEFINKEGKWFSTVKGATTYHRSSSDSNVDEMEFSVQGLGIATVGITGTPSVPYLLRVQPGTANAANTANWDSTADSTKWRIIQAAITNPTTHVQGTAVADGYRDVIIDNLQANSSGVLVYSGFDIAAEMFEVPGPDAAFATTSGSGWGTTTYIYTAHAGWQGDTVFSSGNTVANSGGGIWKVEFTDQGNQGPSNTVRARIYFKGFTAMPASDQTFNVDIDVKSSVRIPPGAPPSNPLRQSSFRISHNP